MPADLPGALGDDMAAATDFLADLVRQRVALLAASERDRERLARALRKATVQLNVTLGECNVVNYAPEAGDDRNPGGLCGPCCELLADAIIAAMEEDR